MSWAKRLEEQGARMTVAAVDPSASQQLLNTEICLPKLLLVTPPGSARAAVNGLLHVEIAPLVVGGLEALRVLLAVRDLLSDAVGAAVIDVGELQQALRHIDQFAREVDGAVNAARSEHDGFHAREQRKGPLH